MPQFAIKQKYHAPRPELTVQPGIVRPSGRLYHQPESVQPGSDILADIDAALEENAAGLEDQPQQPTTTATLSSAALSESVSISGIKHEKYARSMGTVRRLGRVGVLHCLEAPEGRAVLTNAKKDRNTTIKEMVKSGEEFYGQLEISHEDSFPVIDNKMTDDEGTPMMEVNQRSIAKAREAAKEDRRMTTQVCRDEAQLYSAWRVDDMVAGRVRHNTRVVVSVEPVEAMARDGVDYWTNGKKGFYYIKGMALIQMHHFDGTKVVTGTYSVDLSDKHTWRKLLAQYGVHIPEGETTDTWVKHGIELTLTKEQALALPRTMRRQYYEMRGCKKQRYSVDEIMDLHRAQLDRDFDALYVPMAQAAYERKKNAVVHMFVKQLLAKPRGLKSEVRQQLAQIYTKETFDDADARLVEGLMNYATVESLHENVKRIVSGVSYKDIVRHHIAPETRLLNIPIEQLIQIRINQAMLGITAGRSYGACGSRLRLSDETKNPFSNLIEGFDFQEAYGDKGNSEDTEEQTSEDGAVPDHIRCPECKATSAKEDVLQKDGSGEVEAWKCPCCSFSIDICTGEVLCKSSVKKNENGWMKSLDGLLAGIKANKLPESRQLVLANNVDK